MAQQRREKLPHTRHPTHEHSLCHAIRVAEAAGFVVEGDSDLLHNPDDDMTQGVFAEGLRGHTNRFLLKLRKPAG